MANAVNSLSLDEKLNLVQRRARIMGFRRHDIEDAVQEVMLSVLEFEYDPKKSNGATEVTALTTIVDHKLVSLKRAKRRYAGLMGRAKEQLAAEYQRHEEGPCLNDRAVEERILRGEMEAVIIRMDEERQQICRLLMEGASTKGIADELQMGWHRADRLAAAIRERFEAAGLHPVDAWS